MTPALTWRLVERYRRQKLARYHIRSKRQALGFVGALGFCYAFTSGPGYLPGLFDVLATRSVDRMWSWAWRWKDELATERRLFYGRVLRRKPTYISNHYLPHFFALSGNVGERDDYLQAYREGRLSLLAKSLFEYVQAQGPCSTWVLRRQFVPRGERDRAFHKALKGLEGTFLLAKVGESERGSYSYLWDTFDRWMPQIVRAAGRITAVQAAAAVLDRYLQTVGAAPPAAVRDLFDWPASTLEDARQSLGDRIVPSEVENTNAWAHMTLVRSLA